MQIRLVFLFLFLSFQSISQDVYSVLTSSLGHNTFVELLELTGLDSVLKDNIFYSVFAPNNATFEDIYTFEELDSLKVNELEYLKSLLRHHIVPDTVVPGFTGPHLPLQGSHINQFIDGAGQVLIFGLGSIYAAGESPRLVYSANDDDAFLDVTNGRILWMERNLIYPLCIPLSELDYRVTRNLDYAIRSAELEDTLRQHPGPLTFLNPTGSFNDHIVDNGGFEKTPFLDSIVRRHIINEHLPLQKIQDGITAKNLLDETILFTKEDNSYFANGNQIGYNIDYKHIVSLTFIDGFLEEPTTSSINENRVTELQIFPNPAANTVWVQNIHGKNTGYLEVYSIDGGLISKEEFSTNEVNMDISQFEPGLYILKYRNESTLEIVRLMVVN